MKWLRDIFTPTAGSAPIELAPAPAPKDDQDAWRAEWNAARDAALAKIKPPASEYLIWQNRDTGIWHTGKWVVETVPRFFDEYGLSLLFSRPRKPDMRVLAFGAHRPFTPIFKTEREARKWLGDYLNPPPAKQFGFDKTGAEVKPPPPLRASPESHGDALKTNPNPPHQGER